MSFAAFLTEQTQAAQNPRPCDPRARERIALALDKAKVILAELPPSLGDHRMLDIAARQAENVSLYLNDALRELVLRNGGVR
jgi:hypothetical protein